MRAAALAAACAVLCALAAGIARGDADADAEGAFHAALAAGDLDSLERIGASVPATRWADDAWSEAAHLAERRGDLARANRDFAQVIAVGGDEQLVRRARLALERLSSVAGPHAEWTAVADEHDRLVPALRAGTDPTPALRRLEALVTTHPGYPRASAAMVAIAAGWEREGEAGRAVHWLDEAARVATSPLDRLHAQAERVRTVIRAGDLDRAEREISTTIAAAGEPSLVRQLRALLDRARLRRDLRWGAFAVLAVLAALTVLMLRRSAPSWRATLRRLARPPLDALFLVPIAGVLVGVAYTGNPLVARAVRTIVLAGLAVTWFSGAILDGRAGPIAMRRALVHALLAVVAVVAATYLAVDSGHLINFVVETWRAGPEH